jgi:mRNA interferase RelE/StbE
MKKYKIEWKKSAVKELLNIDKKHISAIIKQIDNLVENPTPIGTKKLVGTEKTYRLRIGDYRIIYEVDADKIIIRIVRVRHRKDVYRK